MSRRAYVAYLLLTAAWLAGAAFLYPIPYPWFVANAIVWWGLLTMAIATGYYIIQEAPAARVTGWIRRDFLVNGIASQGELLNAARNHLEPILSKAPLAVQYALEATLRGADLALDDGLYLEATLFGMACGTEDMKEGTRAFLEKRKAEFKGR